jgi:DNA-binding MarR family transcriptional regulator
MKPELLAASLTTSIGLMTRRGRALAAATGLSLPQRSALGRLDREGPQTAAALAKAEHISPQSMGATLAALQEQGLVERAPDPDDGRRIVLSLSAAGRKVVRTRRDERTQVMARALGAEFSDDELQTLAAAAPLLERLAYAL